MGTKNFTSLEQQHNLKWDKKQTNYTGLIHSIEVFFHFILNTFIYKAFETFNVL